MNRDLNRSDCVVFWDFDGTLARRPDMWAGALLDALRVLEPDTRVSVEDLRPGLRNGFPWHRAAEIVAEPDPIRWWTAMRPTFAGAYGQAGVGEESATAAIELVGTLYYRPSAWQVIAGAAEALRLTAEAGFRNAILSNHAPELPQLVESLGLSSEVERVFTSAAIGAEKPNPRIFSYAVEAMGAGRNSWMVGDNPIADIEGARAVGLRAILADGAYPDARGVTVLEAAGEIVERSKPPS